MITLRPAIITDLALLRLWDKQPHIIISDPNDDWDWEKELLRTPLWREQLIAELDKRPLGFVQIIDPAAEETHYWGAVPPNLRAIDIWIGMAADLGRGYGTQIMQQALTRCFAASEVEAVLVDPLVSNTRAIRFYARLGFTAMERRRLGKDECWVYSLTREQWEKQ